MIFNHIGANHPWVLDVPSKDWFNVSPSKRGNHAKAIFYDNYASTYDSEVMKYAGFGIDLNQANPHVLFRILYGGLSMLGLMRLGKIHIHIPILI